MPLRVLIAPDKFKGTLTAPEAAQAMQRGWLSARPGDVTQLLPMSDGGDGFGAILSELLRARPQQLQTVDAAHRPCTAEWWWEEQTRTAVIEAARINGLAQLTPGRYHPFELDTLGLGAALQAALALGATRCLMGIGGSATNDGGFGLARASGFRFLDAQDREIQRWTDLDTLARIQPPSPQREFEEFIVAVDVQNPLLGPNGCTRVYGPQKGLREVDWPVAEKNLGRLAEIVREQFQLNCAEEPGAGAAGGLGFGLRSFFGARLAAGFELFARHAELLKHLRSVQLVLTGEGALDAQTLMGKGVGELAVLCKKHNLPCLGLAGVVPDARRARELFTQTFALTPDLTTPERAQAEAGFWLEQAAAQAARAWRGQTHSCTL
jgi:glycerate kinase